MKWNGGVVKGSGVKLRGWGLHLWERGPSASVKNTK